MPWWLILILVVVGINILNLVLTWVGENKLITALIIVGGIAVWAYGKRLFQ